MSVLYTPNAAETLQQFISRHDYDRVFLFDDAHTHEQCWPLLSSLCGNQIAFIQTMPAGDVAKGLDSLAALWQMLSTKGASRRSLLVNLGGGVVTDLGGFAAATFKRGMDFVNIPTTLLAMVDAAVGGKTGINFNGLKNEIGAFRPAEKVIIDTTFLRTLDDGNLRSGYAEMLKHALLSDAQMWAEHLQTDFQKMNFARLATLVRQSVEVKARIVTEDPCEKGLRKALNLGHTFGHAFESLALHDGRPVLHGYAVAWGMVCELYLSALLQGFPTERLHATVRFIREVYGRFTFTCRDYDMLMELMQHDKKNVGGQVRLTLLSDIGQVCLDCHASREQMCEAFDFLREG